MERRAEQWVGGNHGIILVLICANLAGSFFETSIEVKHFLHGGPDFAGRAVGQQFEPWHTFSPPALRCGVGGNPRRVGGKIVSSIFKITEQVMPAIGEFAEVNRIVANVAARDDRQHFWPRRRVQFLVARDHAVFHANHRTVALNRIFHGHHDGAVSRIVAKRTSMFSGAMSGRIASWLGEIISPVGNSFFSSRTRRRTASGEPCTSRFWASTPPQNETFPRKSRARPSASMPAA